MAKNPRLGKLLNSRLEKLFTKKYLEEEARERAEGKIEGRAEAEAEAKAEALAAMRDTILKLLRLRFPRLVGEAWNAIDEIDSYDTLGQLMAEFSVALDEDSARRALEAHTQQ